MLNLHDPIAVGHERRVFIHPGDARLVIKVRRAGSPQDRSAIEAEYIRAARPTARVLVPSCGGIVETDQGTGHVFNRITDTDGSTSRTVYQAIDAGVVSHEIIEAKLHAFFRKAIAAGLLLYDHNPGNFLYQCSDGNGRLVIVDGFGPRWWSWRAALRAKLPILARGKTAHSRDETMAQWRIWLARRS